MVLKWAVGTALAAFALHFGTKDIMYHDELTRKLVEENGTMWAYVTESRGKLVMKEVPIPKPGPGMILVKMIAAPINPSDAYLALGEYEGLGKVSYPHLNGLEGVGKVVASGGGVFPYALKNANARVAIASAQGGTWAEYAVADPMQSIPLWKGIKDEQGAMALVNPLTTVAMLEIAAAEGHRAIVHTAASSALGLMLIRAAQQYHVKILCVVRGEKNEKFLLEAIKHPRELVVRSDVSGFQATLKTAARNVKATLAFDAVGGKLSEQIYDAMPEESSSFIYGELSGEGAPDSVYEKGRENPTKKFGRFHVKNWLDEGGFLRLVKCFYPLLSMLGKELSTEVGKTLSFKKKSSVTEIEEYYKHQKGGKMILRMEP